MEWSGFARLAPELAAFGSDRLGLGLAYLATLRRAGAPRIHPVTPIARSGHLFVFLGQASPKCRDLQRDPRYGLHAPVGAEDGGGGEFWVSGEAEEVDDPSLAELAGGQSPFLAASVLFELLVHEAGATHYGIDKPVHELWRPPVGTLRRARRP